MPDSHQVWNTFKTGLAEMKDDIENTGAYNWPFQNIL